MRLAEFRALENHLNQRLTLPAKATAAIADAQQSISQAVASANRRIDSENALISQSFSLANAMAKVPST